MRLAIFALALVQTVAQTQTHSIEGLQWLAGCWERAGTTGRTVELWTAPAGGVMMGASYFITDTSTREREQLRLWYAGDTLIYEAHPSSQARTLFKSTTVTAGELLFHNPAHDYPQRISYRRQGTDSLIARVEGDRNGRLQPITYPFKRISCGAVEPSKSLAARVSLQALYDEMASREAGDAGGRWAWFQEHAVPGHSIVVWSAPGSAVTVLDSSAIGRIVANARRAPASATQPVQSRITVERVLLRGDTIEAFVSAVTTRFSADTTGRRRERTSTGYWIDAWIRKADALRLLSRRVVREEVSADGRVILINGRTVQP